MSTEANKTIVRRYIEDVWGKGDFEAEKEVIASNVVDHNLLPGFPSGLEGHHQFLVMLRNAFPDLQATLEDLIAEGEIWHQEDSLGMLQQLGVIPPMG